MKNVFSIVLVLLFPVVSFAQDADKEPIEVRVIEEPTSPSETRDIKEELGKGSLIKNGFTAGVSVVGLKGLGSQPGATSTQGISQRKEIEELDLKLSQEDIGTSIMPYVAFMPARLAIKGDITKAYCASKWALSNPKEVANSLAYSKAKSKVSEYCKDNPNESKCSESSIRKFNSNPSADPNFVKKLTGWNPKLKGSCKWAHVPGIYIGVPSDFKTNAYSNVLNGTFTAEFDPMISVGIAYAPISAFSFLIGYSRAQVHASEKIVVPAASPDEEDSALEFTRTVYTNHIVVGIGANFDLAGLLLK